MQTVLEQGSIDKPLTFDVGLIQLSFIPVCSLNTCNISVKLCRGFAALQCFSLYHVLSLAHILIHLLVDSKAHIFVLTEQCQGVLCLQFKPSSQYDAGTSVTCLMYGA